MKYYYYSDNDQRFGPFTLDELKNKRIGKTALVWTDGMEDWAPAESLQELKEILISEPPPLPLKEKDKIESPQAKQSSTVVKAEIKYDLSYKKEGSATFFGVLLLIGVIILQAAGGFDFGTDQFFSALFFSITLLVLYIIAIVTVVKIASRQNRNTTGWGIFAFFLPSIALIIIGQLRKLRLTIKIDESLPTEQQTSFLFEKAQKLFDSNRDSECLDILNKIIDIDKYNYESIRLRGLLFYQMREKEKARVDFENLLQVEQFEAESDYYLGNLAAEIFDRKTAISFWTKALEKGYRAAKEKLDLYSNYTHNYLLKEDELKKKLGEFVCVSIQKNIKYIKGLPSLDQNKKNQNRKVQINEYSNGFIVKLEFSFKYVYVAIAYYEIDDIKYDNEINQLKLRLSDRNTMLFEYNKSKDDASGLERIIQKYQELTGRTEFPCD